MLLEISHYYSHSFVISNKFVYINSFQAISLEKTLKARLIFSYNCFCGWKNCYWTHDMCQQADFLCHFRTIAQGNWSNILNIHWSNRFSWVDSSHQNQMTDNNRYQNANSGHFREIERPLNDQINMFNYSKRPLILSFSEAVKKKEHIRFR